MKVFKSIEEAQSFISTMCNAYTTVLDQHLISHDSQIDMEVLLDVHNECESVGCTYAFWIGIRRRGCESSTNKYHVINRIKELGDECLCAIKVSNENGVIEVCYKQNQLNF